MKTLIAQFLFSALDLGSSKLVPAYILIESWYPADLVDRYQVRPLQSLEEVPSDPIVLRKNSSHGNESLKSRHTFLLYTQQAVNIACVQYETFASRVYCVNRRQ
jgi:hypothetical protein